MQFGNIYSAMVLCKQKGCSSLIFSFDGQEMDQGQLGLSQGHKAA